MERRREGGEGSKRKGRSGDCFVYKHIYIYLEAKAKKEPRKNIYRRTVIAFIRHVLVLKRKEKSCPRQEVSKGLVEGLHD